MLKKIGITLLSIIVFFGVLIVWLMSLLDADIDKAKLIATKPQDISYLSQAVKPQRGKILAVVTSTATMGVKNKKTGYELSELSRAYYVFQTNGFEVDIASTQGGKAPAVLDDDDMAEFDYAFLNDVVAMQKANNTLNINNIKADDYQAIYFVGGKGTMFDFPNNPAIKKLVLDFEQKKKVIAAVCHGPAALSQVMLADGTPFLKNKRVSGFTNEEELFLIPKAKDLFPFLLEDELIKQGATFEKGGQYLKQISHDGNLITGQNPWSVWAMAEATIKQLGYQPVARNKTSEEVSVDILNMYEQHGYGKTKTYIQQLLNEKEHTINGNLIAMHALVAAMSYKPTKTVQLIGLLRVVKS